MQWIEAAERNACARGVLKSFPSKLIRFLREHNDAGVAEECLRRWWADDGLFLPFSLRSSLIDLSFLQGLVIEESMNVAVAMKKGVPKNRGYTIVGAAFKEDDWKVLRGESFSGFGSKRWHKLSFGQEGLSIYVHLQGGLSITRFYYDDWKLRIETIISRSMVDLTANLKTKAALKKFLKSKKIPAGSLDILVKLIYDTYIELQVYRLCKSEIEFVLDDSTDFASG